MPVSNWVWVEGFLFNPLGIGWTLAIEDQFYLVWPFVLALLLVRRRLTRRICAVLVVALAIAAVVWHNFLWVKAGLMVYQRTDFHTAELLIGCAAALAVVAAMIPTSQRACQVLGVLAWASHAGILIMFIQGEPLYLNVVVDLIALLTIVLITHLVVNRGGRLAALLSWSLLVGVDQVSYGLYPWHWVWLQYPLSVDPARLPMLAIVLTSGTVLASYYLVERPALRLKDRFEPGRGARPTSSVTRGNEPRLSRRALLPALGVASVAVSAAAVHGMADRFFPIPVVALAAPPPPVPTPTSVPTATPVPTSTPVSQPTRVPRPTRVPHRSSREIGGRDVPQRANTRRSGRPARPDSGATQAPDDQ